MREAADSAEEDDLAGLRNGPNRPIGQPKNDESVVAVAGLQRRKRRLLCRRHRQPVRRDDLVRQRVTGAVIADKAILIGGRQPLP